MVNFLRKLFIKNYDDLNDPIVREKHGLLASIGGIIINVILFSFKIAVGVIAKSMSIISDAINNLTDFFGCGVNLIGFKISSMPADKKHPFGHQRVEYISGMIVSFIIIAAGIVVGYEAIQKLVSGENNVAFSLWSFIILGVAIILKLYLAYYYYKIGKIINSVSLKASMQDSINDAICTTCVLIGALVSFYVPSIWWLDPALSLIVAIFVFYNGFKMVLETASPLIGTAPDAEKIKEIQKSILSYDGVLGIHDVICHTYGPNKLFMSVHVEIDAYQDIMTAHDMIDNIESDIKEKYSIEITIHMDPIDTKNPLIPELRKQVSSIIKAINPSLTFHDLRVVYGPTHTNILFDVLVNFDCKIPHDLLEKEIKKKVEELSPNYFCVINIDCDYLD